MPGTTITLTPVAAPLSSVAGTHRRRHTAYDLMERMISWLGGDAGKAAHRDIKRGIEDAYREFPALHDWSYLDTQGRILLHGQQTTGTIEYDHSGAAYERLVTLTGATWPTWAERGFLRVGELIYQIEYRIDSTRLTLTEGANPGADLAALTTYTLAQDSYPMPADFLAGDSGQTENGWGGMEYVPAREWLAEARHDGGNANSPRCFTYTGDPRGTGGLVLRINPSPDADQTLDLVYRRTLRPIRVWEAATGTATVAAASTVLTLGGGGILKEWMEGSIVRLSSGTTMKPGGSDSPDEYVLERTILQVLSSTTAQMDEAADESLTAVAYRISDPLDVEDQMLNALVFGARKHIAMARGRDDAKEFHDQWLFQLRLAQEADCRDLSRRAAGPGGIYVRRLSDGRRGSDIE